MQGLCPCNKEESMGMTQPETDRVHLSRLRRENGQLTGQLERRTRAYHQVLEWLGKLVGDQHALLIERDNLLDRVRELEREALGMPGKPEPVEDDPTKCEEVAS
jgi:hypothetical protein